MATDETRRIRLIAREFRPRAGLGKGLADRIRELGDEKRVHVLVQLAGPRQPRDHRLLMAKAKIRLLDPIPENAFFAAMPPDARRLKGVVGSDGPLRWIGLIEPRDKVAPWLLDEIPEHARREDGTAELVVQFFGDVAKSRQQTALNAHGADVVERVEEINGWHVALDPKRLLKLAGEDPVKWIEAVPAPAEIDNDGVRSATGVDADAVLAPAAYNVTGANVVVGHWEPNHADLNHADFAGRITLADPPLLSTDRSYKHDETVAANNLYDNGEAVYVDRDDSGTVSAGDLRVTAVGGFLAGSVVAAGDADVGRPLALFAATERFADTVTADGLYTAGEAIYRNNANNFVVTAGDVRLTPVGAFAAGSVVAAGNADVGQALRDFLTNPHGHPTHVAGTVMGSGAQSVAQGGSANQWKGVAPGASLRSYATASMPTDYADAAAAGVTISTNSWGSTHMHQVTPPATGYDSNSQLYDAVISGRQSDGSASGLVNPVLVLGSSGNAGRPERHAENVGVNGLYDSGEAIYVDFNDNGVVGGDILLTGPAQALNTPLVNFGATEMHADPAGAGAYSAGEAVYRDVDGSRTVTVGDVRVTATGGFAAGSVVAAGDADVGTFLRQFNLWGNVRVPNSAKGTVEVANISSDASKRASASTSRGPTNDGRLKPDVAGPGSQIGGDGGVTSTFPGNRYAGMTGTSMSTPAVAGCAALLTEWYRNACVAAGPRPDALRALLIHGAEDLTTIPNVPGNFVGPDYAHGYGRVRVKESLDLVPHHLQGTAAAVGDQDYTVTIGTMPQLKVTLAWSDPAWTANAAPSAVTGILQNDLDLLLIAPDGTQHTPWVLNPANPFLPATRSAVATGTPVPAAARDRRNTVEQVVVDNPAAGTWTIRVTASTLNLPSQPYTVVSEALAPQAGPCAVAGGDVWMMDNATDTGAVPSSGTMWLSPDIWNRIAADGQTAHQNPEFGQTNNLYANIRNRSNVVVGATSIDVWIAPASAGLAWPANFSFVGRISAPNLAPNSVRQVGPLAWTPPPPMPSNHYCMYVRVQSPQDPITIAETTNVGSNASQSNNIVWRNLNVVDLQSTESVTFLVRNIRGKAAKMDLELSVPRKLLKAGVVLIGIPPEIDKLWDRKEREGAKGLELVEDHLIRERMRAAGVGRRELLLARPTFLRVTAPKVAIRGVRLEAGQEGVMRLTFRVDATGKTSNDVDVVQSLGGRVVGGIRYVVRTGQIVG